MASSHVLAATLCAVLALGAQGFGLSNVCNHNIPGSCTFASMGQGSCESLKGASHKSNVKSVGECRGLCQANEGCAYYSYCSSGDDCPALFKNVCGMVVNDECKMVTSMSRDKLSTYKLYEAVEAGDAQPAASPRGWVMPAVLGFLAGMAVTGAAVGVAKRARSPAQAGALSMEAGLVQAEEEE
jgi:hypothetical protein